MPSIQHPSSTDSNVSSGHYIKIPDDHNLIEGKAIDLPPLPKVVIFALDRGVLKLLSPINMSSKRIAAASIGSPSGHPPMQQFRMSPMQPSFVTASPAKFYHAAAMFSHTLRLARPPLAP